MSKTEPILDTTSHKQELLRNLKFSIVVTLQSALILNQRKIKQMTRVSEAIMISPNIDVYIVQQTWPQHKTHTITQIHTQHKYKAVIGIVGQLDTSTTPSTAATE